MVNKKLFTQFIIAEGSQFVDSKGKLITANAFVRNSRGPKVEKILILSVDGDNFTYQKPNKRGRYMTSGETFTGKQKDFAGYLTIV